MNKDREAQLSKDLDTLAGVEPSEFPYWQARFLARIAAALERIADSLERKP